MNRYVDAEWLLGVAKLSNGIVDIDDIYNAPSIDIVRCVGCKHRINDDSFVSGHICLKRRANGGAFCEDNDFCSYGEEKE